jgi:hypothetical protein
MQLARRWIGFLALGVLRCAEIEATRDRTTPDGGGGRADAEAGSDAGVGAPGGSAGGPRDSDAGSAEGYAPREEDGGTDGPESSDAGSEAGRGDGDADRGAPPPAECAGRLVCDDFEGAATGQAPNGPWKIGAIEKGHIVVDEARAFSGRKSVRFTVDAMTSASDISRHATIEVTAAPLFPLANDRVYGRFMLYTNRIPPYPNHWTTAQGSGPVAAAGDAIAEYNYGGQGNLMANYYRPLPGGGKVDCWQTKGGSFPTNKWTCVAFMFDGKANEMRYWQDGTEVPELHVLGLAKRATDCTDKTVDGRWLAPEFGKISIGWQSYGYDATGMAHDAWIDDVILDDEPIGCPAP